MTAPDQQQALVLQHARALGCTCQPDIQLAKDGDTIRVTVAHDHDCAIMVQQDGQVDT
jgi:hypothetical protein